MYSGVDKYGGDIVCDYNQPEVDISEVLATSSATETIVATDENNQEVLLEAHLNCRNGQLEWSRSEDSTSTYRMVVTMSQMSSMLKDSRRNELYNRAITKAIHDFIEQRGYPPVVLDIGCGTGLLSMQAARAGAQKVYGCEQFKEMAHIAQNVVKENGFESVITILPVRSTSLHVREENMESNEDEYLIERCDILVSELLDTELLGEGVLDTVRRAKMDLLKPEAVILPDYAEVWVQGIHSQELYNTINTTNLNIESIPLCINDEQDCLGSEKVIPIQYDAFYSSIVPLTDPYMITYVNLGDPGEASIKCATLPMTLYSKSKIVDSIHQRHVSSAIPMDKKRVAMNGLLLFWKLYIYDDIVYSTGREIDHQLDSYVPTASSDPSSFEEVVHSTWQDHWLVGYVYMKTKKFRYSTPVDLIFMQNDTQWKFRVYDKEEPQEDIQELVQPSTCRCGLHFLLPPSILSAINNNYIYKMMAMGLSHLLRDDSSRYLNVLDVGDGSLVSLLFHSLYTRKYRTHTNHLSITSLDTKELSRFLFSKIFEFNQLSSIQILDMTVDSPEMSSIAEGSIHYLISDLYHYQMLSSPLLSIFSFWAQRTAVRKYLSPTCQFFPYQASIQCLPVTIPNLYNSFGPVGEASSFSHRFFDEQCLQWNEYLYPYPLHMYHFQALSPPHCLYSLCYENEFSPVSQDVELSIAEDGVLQALVIYVNYSLLKNQSILIDTFKDGRFLSSEKQLVRFMRTPRPVHKGDHLLINISIDQTMTFRLTIRDE